MGGTSIPMSRPSWNYDLMAIGFVLALVPTLLVITGLVRAAAASFRRTNPVWCLLIGVFLLYALALLNMSFAVAAYSQTKAFYGLPVLLPFCALGALGFEFWIGRGKMIRHVVLVALGLWLINLYATFWIAPRSAATELTTAIRSCLYFKNGFPEAFADFQKDHPADIRAVISRVMLGDTGHPEQGVKQLERVLPNDPANADIHLTISQELVLCQRAKEAMIHARRAAELAPEDVDIQENRALQALHLDDYNEAVAAGRAALSVSPAHLQSHFNLGVALMKTGQPEAINHFALVLNVLPGMAAAQYDLGCCLLNQPGGKEEGLRHLREAVRLSPGEAEWQATLKKALEAP